MRRLIGYLLIGLLMMFVFVFVPSCKKAEEGADKATGVAEQMNRGTATDEALSDLDDGGD
jgi:hypothetical protein